MGDKREWRFGCSGVCVGSGGEAAWDQIPGDPRGQPGSVLSLHLDATMWRRESRREPKLCEYLTLILGFSQRSGGGRGLDHMTSGSFFQPQGSVVVRRQIEGNKNRGPWPGFLSVINLIHCRCHLSVHRLIFSGFLQEQKDLLTSPVLQAASEKWGLRPAKA